jgi:mycoredoxin
MIKVYGTEWCGDTKRTLSYLDGLNVEYDYIDIEKDNTAAEWVKSQNGGKELKPTLIIGSKILAVPNEDELDAALNSK